MTTKIPSAQQSVAAQSVTSNGNTRCACTYDSRQNPSQALHQHSNLCLKGQPQIVMPSLYRHKHTHHPSCRPPARLQLRSTHARAGGNQPANFSRTCLLSTLPAFSHIHIRFPRSRWCGQRKPLHPICTDPLQESQPNQQHPRHHQQYVCYFILILLF
jgi:hypothetical protein